MINWESAELQTPQSLHTQPCHPHLISLWLCYLQPAAATSPAATAPSIAPAPTTTTILSVGNVPAPAVAAHAHQQPQQGDCHGWVHHEMRWSSLHCSPCQ